MNIIILSGNTTKDIYLELNQSPYAVFTLAVPRITPRNGQTADYVKCLAFGAVATRLSKFVHKGDKIQVTGYLQIDMYEAADGSRRVNPSVVVEKVEFINLKKELDSEDDSPYN